MTRSRIPIIRRTPEISMETPVIPARLGRPMMIPTLKKTSACDSISRIFLVFWLRQPRPVMVSIPADRRTVHFSRNGTGGSVCFQMTQVLQPVIRYSWCGTAGSAYKAFRVLTHDVCRPFHVFE